MFEKGYLSLGLRTYIAFPFAFVLGFMGAILALQAAAFGQRIVMARLLGAAQVGEFLLPQAYGQLAFAVAFPLFLLTGLVLHRRRIVPSGRDV